MLAATAEGTQNKNWLGVTLNSYLLDVLVNDLKEHPDKVEDEEHKFIIDTHAKWTANNFPQWRVESDLCNLNSPVS